MHTRLLEQFQGLAWIPIQSKLLDYDNTQILLIGQGEDTSNAKEVKPSHEDGEEKEELDNLEQLADEDAQRVDNVSGKYCFS